MEPAKKPVLFYGAGPHGVMLRRFARRKSEAYGEPVGYIDGDIYKQGHDVYGLPVISWADARKRYGEDFSIYVTANPMTAPQIMGFLLEQGVPPRRIINYEPVEKRLGCPPAESYLQTALRGSELQFYTCRGAGDNLLNMVGLPFSQIQDFWTGIEPENLRSTLAKLFESAEKLAAGETFDGYCTGCVDLRTQYFFKQRKFRQIEACGAAPCNINCCYCIMYKNAEPIPNVPGPYEEYLALFDRLEELGVLEEDTVLNASAGEFTVAKDGERFVERWKDHPLYLLTNGYIYSPVAAEALENAGLIYCSVDAGTEATYRRVKGVDGWRRVGEHLRAYAEHGPLYLKYILLEGVNDTWEDLEGFFRLADGAAARVVLTRDFFDASCFSDRTLEWAARFIRHFRDQGRLNMNGTEFVRPGEGERLDRILEGI